MSVASGAPPTFVLPESPDHQIVTVGTVETQNVQDRLPVGGKNDLTDSQQRLSPRHIQKICRAGVRCGCVHFFVRVSDFNLVITLQDAEQRFPLERSREQTRKLGCREVAGLERKGLSCGVSQALEFNDAAFRRKREPGVSLLLVIDYLCE